MKWIKLTDELPEHGQNIDLWLQPENGKGRRFNWTWEGQDSAGIMINGIKATHWIDVCEPSDGNPADLKNANCAIFDVVCCGVLSERFFTCDCKGEGLLLTNDKEDKSIYFALYGYGVGYNPKPSLINRIKYAWYHIKTGKKYADCIIMDYQKAKEVSSWLDSNAR